MPIALTCAAAKLTPATASTPMTATRLLCSFMSHTSLLFDVQTAPRPRGARIGKPALRTPDSTRTTRLAQCESRTGVWAVADELSAKSRSINTMGVLRKRLHFSTHRARFLTTFFRVHLNTGVQQTKSVATLAQHARIHWICLRLIEQAHTQDRKRGRAKARSGATPPSTTGSPSERRYETSRTRLKCARARLGNVSASSRDL